jgi:NAD(P)-dependent dehydrogenase (short-subunit alcohol dehydrogenase family)
MHSHFRLEGRIALVTGGSGIGEATCSAISTADSISIRLVRAGANSITMVSPSETV